MSDTVERVLQLKKHVEEYKAERDRAEGHRRGLLKQLKAEYNCSTVEEGEVLLRELQDRVAKLDAELEKGLGRLEREYGVV